MGAFGRYLLLRLGRAALTVFAVVTLVFLLVRVIPGDPVDTMLGDQAAPEDRAALRHALALDAPLPSQYARFVGQVVDGSLGHSFRQRDRTVASLLLEVAPSTVALTLAALLVGWGLAIPLGIVAAVRRGTRVDRVASTFGVLGLAIPHIWLGPMLVLLFAVTLRWLPLPGGDHVGVAALVLPAFTLGTGLAAILMRQTRAAMLEVLSEQYVVAARARGLRESTVVLRHAFRNALLPVLTVGAAQLGALLSGAVITEKIFERQGLGTLFLEAFFTRDFPVIQGAVIVFGTTYVLVQVLVDVVYGVADPRVRLA
ncbi:MAG: ABC transporter permease [Polyangiales bacterium]